MCSERSCFVKSFKKTNKASNKKIEIKNREKVVCFSHPHTLDLNGYLGMRLCLLVFVKLLNGPAAEGKRRERGNRETSKSLAWL